MIRLAALLVTLTGCAPTLRAGLDTVEKGAKTLDVALDVSAETWELAVQQAIRECRSRALETEQERRECLGVFAEGDAVVPALRQASEGYDMLTEALRLLREAESQLRPYLEQAKDKRP